MKINNTLFPYPVLTNFNDDYINSKFEVDYSLKSKGLTSKSLVAEFILEDSVIEKLIEVGKASFVLHIECPRTTFRKVEKLKKESIEININEDLMRDVLYINGLVLLNEELEEYTNKNINPNYYGENYVIKNLSKGNILCATLTQELDIRVDGDDLENLSSIITVGQSKDSFMNVDIDGEVILVKLPEKDYERYYLLSNTVYSDIVMSATIMPSLAHVLDLISQGKVIDTSLSWYRVLEEKLSINNLGFEDINQRYSSLELAQMILESPIERSLSKLHDEIEREVES